MKKLFVLFVVLLLTISAFAYSEDFTKKFEETIDLPNGDFVNFHTPSGYPNTDYVNIDIIHIGNDGPPQPRSMAAGEEYLFFNQVYVKITGITGDEVTGTVVSPDFPDFDEWRQ